MVSSPTFLSVVVEVFGDVRLGSYLDTLQSNGSQ